MVDGNYVFGIGFVVLIITSFAMLFDYGIDAFIVGIIYSIPMGIMFFFNYKFNWFNKGKTNH